MFGWITSLAGFAAPLFLIMSPILSYSDQAYSMHRNKSSKGFSLDIPLIMLVASFLRVFYYPGARFDTALLIQSFIMIGIQLILLKVALDHRPPPSVKGGDLSAPFSGAQDNNIFTMPRPYNFWQWRSSRPYWQFILYLFITLTSLELLLAPMGSIYGYYSSAIGYIGLSVEATLPLPQIFANHRSRSCKGFRFSVLLSWLAGDAMKMFWFFTASSAIPWSFKLSGMFQACCDSFLGLQYWMYGEGDAEKTFGMVLMKDNAGQWRPRTPSGVGSFSPRRSVTPVAEKSY